MYHSVIKLKIRGKLASKCLTLDLLFSGSLFLQNLQEFNYTGAVLMSHSVETEKWQ